MKLNGDRLLTAALVIDAQAVDANIEATPAALGGDAGRWRPHAARGRESSPTPSLPRQRL